jgi:hypothetical protein
MHNRGWLAVESDRLLTQPARQTTPRRTAYPDGYPRTPVRGQQRVADIGMSAVSFLPLARTVAPLIVIVENALIDTLNTPDFPQADKPGRCLSQRMTAEGLGRRCQAAGRCLASPPALAAAREAGYWGATEQKTGLSKF